MFGIRNYRSSTTAAELGQKQHAGTKLYSRQVAHMNNANDEMNDGQQSIEEP
jgi:hypothetical protein